MISPFRIKTGCLVACRINHHLFSPNVSFNIHTTTTTTTTGNNNVIIPITEIEQPNPTSTNARITTTKSIHHGEHVQAIPTPHESDEITTNNESNPTAVTTSASSTTTTTTATTTQIIQYTNDSYQLVWTDPIRHRDLYWSLIGKRIRCCYYIPEQQHTTISSPNTTTTTASSVISSSSSSSAKKKTFDGEVIRLFHNHHHQYNNTNGNNNHHSNSDALFSSQQDVELLIDAAILSKLPFLQPIHQNNNTKDIESLSKKERRSYELEQHVARGLACSSGGGSRFFNNNTNNNNNNKNEPHQKSLVSVRITLQYPQMDDTTTTRTIKETSNRSCMINIDGTSQQGEEQQQYVVIRKWVIQKCTPTQFGKKSSHSNPKKRKAVSNFDERTNDNNNNRTKNNNDITTSSLLSSVNAILQNNMCESQTTTNTGESNNDIRDMTKKILNGNGMSSDNKNNNNGNMGIVRPSSHKNNINGVGDSIKRSKKKNDVAGNDNNNLKAVSAAASRSTSSNHINNKFRAQQQQQYIGDGNDTPEQQAYNWRFIASRYYDLLHQSIVPLQCHTVQPSLTLSTNLVTATHFGADILSCGFIGEVIKVDPNAAPSRTLAMVTIRRMILPEHTFSGRCTNIHRWNDVYADYDNTRNQNVVDVTITIPIEQLIVVSRDVNKSNNVDDEYFVDNEDAVIRYSYSRTYNVYIPPACNVSTSSDIAATNHNNMSELLFCHRCRQSSSDSTTMSMTICKSTDCCLSLNLHLNDDATIISKQLFAWCQGCLSTLRNESIGKPGLLLPCCDDSCDCITCIANRNTSSQNRLFTHLLKRTKKACLSTRSDDKKITNDDSLTFSASMLESMGKISSYLDQSITFFNVPRPQTRPKTRIFQRTIRIVKTSSVKSKGTSKASITADKPTSRKRTVFRDGEIAPASVVLPTAIQKLPLLLKKNHCAREIVYNASKKYSFKSLVVEDMKTSFMILETPRSLRTLQESNSRLVTEQKDEVAKTSSCNRAARASQRRLLRDVASLGIAAPSYLGLVDTLANREPQLRFDRSSIHAWGVFADTAISAGEMIVEYRGELIGNAVAELREKEYEAAKIGSDYMFRIDSLNVCDATKQGNVARFINASCDPNCYTKIISFDGLKRIVIYAKKDIQAGDELCYDYKFPIEYDEAKRIRCHCGARECRGYMNWDKKYVATQLHNAQSRGTITEHKPIKCASEAD